MWKCGNTWSLPILISREAYPYFFDSTTTAFSTIQLSLLYTEFFGGHSEKDPPVLIPNTEVKLLCADGTAWVTVWESRSPPNFIL